MRGRRQSFQYKSADKSAMKKYDPRQNPIQITKPDFDMLDMDKINRVITNHCPCRHRENPTDLFMFEYRNGGISIDFRKEDCFARGVLYLTNDGEPKEIEFLSKCI